MKIHGKVALVTGASEGIGKCLVDSLARRGVVCYAVSRHIEQKNPFDQENIRVKNCDVTKPDDIRQLMDFIREKGGLDIVINNAGIWHKKLDVDKLNDDTIADVVNVNLLGTMYAAKYALPMLRQASEGAIVNIISSAGYHAKAGRGAYAASKFGVRGFTDVLREELMDTNIHVMGVFQSGTNTKLFEKAGDDMPTNIYIEPQDLAEQIVSSLDSPSKLWVSEMRVDNR